MSVQQVMGPDTSRGQGSKKRPTFPCPRQDYYLWYTAMKAEVLRKGYYPQVFDNEIIELTRSAKKVYASYQSVAVARLATVVQEMELETRPEVRARRPTSSNKQDSANTATEQSEKVDRKDRKDLEELIQRGHEAYGTVLETLNNSSILLQVVKDCKDAASVLERLEERYSTPRKDIVMNIRRDLRQLKARGPDRASVEAYLIKHEALRTKIVELNGRGIENEEGCEWLHMGLPHTMRATIQALEDHPHMTLDESLRIAHKEVRAYHYEQFVNALSVVSPFAVSSRNNQRETRPETFSQVSPSEKAYAAAEGSRRRTPPTYTKGRPQRPSLLCHQCKSPNHLKRDCPDLKDPSNASATGKNGPERAFMAFAKIQQKEEETSLSHRFILDSGASSHFTPHLEWLEGYQPYANPIQISSADGIEKAYGEGTCTITLEGSEPLPVHKVLYVPSFKQSMLSVSRLDALGLSVSFRAGKAEIRREKELYATATMVEGLYELQADVKQQRKAERAFYSSEARTLDIGKWHTRLGHMPLETIAKAKKLTTGIPDDLVTSQVALECDGCQVGRLARSSFPTRQDMSTKKLQIVHMDIAGPLPTSGINQARYLLVLVDSFTRMTWTRALEQKSAKHLRTSFITWMRQVERQCGERLVTLRSDGDLAFRLLGQELRRDQGITHEVTVPYTPEQNGVAERHIRTIVEKIRSCSLSTGLPDQLWPELARATAYLGNRSPHAGKEKTPIELWSGRKPDLSHLRTLGTKAWVKLPLPGAKLTARAAEMYLVGYDEVTKGWRFYHANSGKICISHTARFFTSQNLATPGTRGTAPSNTNTAQVHLGTTPISPGEEELADEQEWTDEERGLAEPHWAVHEDIKPYEDLSTDDQDASQQLQETTEDFDQPEGSTAILEVPTTEGAYHARASRGSASAPPTPEGDPIDLKDARSRPDWQHWKEAMDKEMSSLTSKHVFEYTKPPTDANIVTNKWVFKLKRKADGSVDKYKARLVARGFSQVYGLDYTETYAPVARLDSVCLVIALAALRNLQLYQLDIGTAYLNGDLSEEIYMRAPNGYEAPGTVVRLRKTLYGLKQAGREWNKKLHASLDRLGWQRMKSESCLYRNQLGYLLCVYVDDLILACPSETGMIDLANDLRREYEVEAAPATSILGIRILDTPSGFAIDQSYAIEALAKRYGVHERRSASTPLTPGHALKIATKEESRSDLPYRELLGGIMYIMTGTRPDLAYPISFLARFSSAHTEIHWNALLRVLTYAYGTRDKALHYDRKGNSRLLGYSDSDWAGDLDTRKSTHGYAFLLAGCAISWKSQRQECVALSSTEAEYIGMCLAGKEACHLRQLLQDLRDNNQDETTTLLVDNQSAMALAKNPTSHARSKHIEIRWHWIRDVIQRGILHLQWTDTHQQLADVLTKALTGERVEYLSDGLGLRLRKDTSDIFVREGVLESSSHVLD